MFLRSKYVNIICIALVATILALGLTAGIFGIIAVLNPESIDMGDYSTPPKTQTVPIILPNDNDNEIPYSIQGQVDSDAVYLRGDSYGDYDGKEWGEATAYTKLIDSKYPATFLGSKSIESMSGAQAVGIAIIPHNSQMIIPSYTATKRGSTPIKEEYTLPQNDVSSAMASQEFMQKSAQERQYLVYYYEYTDTSIEPSGLSSEYKEYEEAYRSFVYGQYLNIDSDMKEYMLKIAEEEKIDKNAADLADKVCLYIANAAEYSVEYDENLDKEDNVIKAFIEEYKKGSCKHFASTATLLFRALGIPARYVTGFLTETRVGEWINVSKEDAHAWVEIYVDGFGWKTVETTPKQMQFTIKPVDVDMVYDGTSLTAEPIVEDVKQEINGESVILGNSFEAFLESSGYTYKAVVSGQLDQPGKGESKIESIKVFDTNGKDVSNMFTFTFEPGKMIHYAGTITLKSSDIDWAYTDGKLESQLQNCSIVVSEAENFSSNYTFTLLKKEISLKIGYRPHDFDIQILDESGSDVSYLYKKVYNLGKVHIYASLLVFESATAEKDYDGAPLIANTYKLKEGSLMDDDTLEISDGFVIGSITNPGVAYNNFDASKMVIKNAAGENVTNNYKFAYIIGMLTVYGKE